MASERKALTRKKQEVAYLCYEVNWHKDCGAVRIEYPWVYCQLCQIYAHIDLVGIHITPDDSAITDRMIMESSAKEI